MKTKVGNYNAGVRIPEPLYDRIDARRQKTLTRFEHLHARKPTADGGASRNSGASLPNAPPPTKRPTTRSSSRPHEPSPAWRRDRPLRQMRLDHAPPKMAVVARRAASPRPPRTAPPLKTAYAEINNQRGQIGRLLGQIPRA
ncbi:hypothetical protein ACQPZP_20635 [Spirillospora sp. CA-142024]|uniref:hypothetical protein n=1 Tax=Spirillospora sp. CA-142024 TaxID=3240036 RepID=UPI003D93545F